MTSPQFKVVYEQHAMPLDGAILSQAQVIRAQQRGYLGHIMVLESIDTPIRYHAVCVRGVWRKVSFGSRAEMRKIIEQFEYREAGGDESEVGEEVSLGQP